MDTVLTLLQKQKKYHQNELRKINKAIAALEDTSFHRDVKWKEEIQNIFDHLSPGTAITTKELAKLLENNGVVFTKTSKNSMYATVNRLVHKCNYLEKTEKQTYRKKL
jgi:hypothetical protein